MSFENHFTAKNIVENLQNKTSWHIFILIFIPFVLYLKVLNFDFVYDDILIIKNNIKTLEQLGNILEAFRRDAFFNNTGELFFYRPIQNVSFMIDAFIGGTNPLFYHFSNLFLHIATCVTLYILLRALFINNFTAFLFAFIFSVHPVLAAGVSWVPSRGDLLIGLFSTLALLTLRAYFRKQKNVYFILHHICFFLAVFSKETTLLLPAILLLYCYYFCKEIFTREALFSFGLLWCTTIGIFFWFKTIIITTSLPTAMFGFQAFAKNLIIFPAMLCKLFFPFGLPLYPPFDTASIVVGILLFFLITGWLIYLYYQKNNAAILGFCWLLLFCLPPLFFRHRFFDITIVTIEQRLFLPAIGFMVFLASALDSTIQKFKNISLYIVVGIALAFSVMAYQHSTDYKNSFTYCNSIIAKNPRNACAYTYRGYAYLGEARNIASALADFNMAIKICGYPPAYFDRGALELMMKDYPSAVQDFSAAITQDSSLILCYLNRGVAEAGMNNFQDAFKDFFKMEQLAPNTPALYLNRGKLYRNLKQNDNALHDFNTCITLNNLNTEAYVNRAEVKAIIGDISGAIEDYTILRRTNPKNITLLMLIARLYHAEQKADESVNTYTAILQIDPYNAEAYYERGLSKLDKQDRYGANADFQKSSELGYSPTATPH